MSARARVGGLLVRLGCYSYHRGIGLLRDYYGHNSTAVELGGAKFQPASGPTIMINTGGMLSSRAAAIVDRVIRSRSGGARWA